MIHPRISGGRVFAVVSRGELSVLDNLATSPCRVSVRRLRRLDDVGPGDLVVPALLVAIEGCPKPANRQPKHDAIQDVADVADDGSTHCYRGAISLNDLDVHRLVHDGEAVSLGPEVDEVDGGADEGKQIKERYSCAIYRSAAGRHSAG